MAQFDTEDPKLIRVRSAFDLRWIAALTVGLTLSFAYYGLLFWAVVSLVRWLLAVWWPGT